MWSGFSTYIETLLVYSCWRWFLIGWSFWIRVIFLLVIHSSILVSSRHLHSFKASLLWMDINFSKSESMHAIMAEHFPIWYFLYVALSDSTSRPSLCLCSFFFLLFIHLAFLFFLFPYFTAKLFCFFCSQLLVYPCVFSTDLLVEFSFIILEGLCRQWVYECPGYDTKQSDAEIPVMLELWGNAEYSFIAITPRSTLARSGSTW